MKTVDLKMLGDIVKDEIFSKLFADGSSAQFRNKSQNPADINPRNTEKTIAKKTTG